MLVACKIYPPLHHAVPLGECCGSIIVLNRVTGHGAVLFNNLQIHKFGESNYQYDTMKLLEKPKALP